MTKEDGYTYYEIWNTISEYASECTERCVTLEIAKEHLEKNHCDWCRPVGTGIIYGVNLVPIDDGTINMIRTEVYRKRFGYPTVKEVVPREIPEAVVSYRGCKDFDHDDYNCYYCVNPETKSCFR